MPPAKKNSTIRAPPACLTAETRHVETTYLNSSTTVKQLEWHFPSGCCPVKLQYLPSGSTTKIRFSQHRMFFGFCSMSLSVPTELRWWMAGCLLVAPLVVWRRGRVMRCCIRWPGRQSLNQNPGETVQLGVNLTMEWRAKAGRKVHRTFGNSSDKGEESKSGDYLVILPEDRWKLSEKCWDFFGELYNVGTTCSPLCFI